ncbi:MAG: hypothetical protein KIS61_04910 [Candidatus Eremiobacteraeota bacterium]|nr:hypothetical protein [Candidatus Eremiobacteraeota bacterium]
MLTLLLLLGAVALAAQFTVVLASPTPSPTPEVTASPSSTATPIIEPLISSQPQIVLPRRPSFGRGIYPPASPHRTPVVGQKQTAP